MRAGIVDPSDADIFGQIQGGLTVEVLSRTEHQHERLGAIHSAFQGVREHSRSAQHSKET